jgi:hypothetical protein
LASPPCATSIRSSSIRQSDDFGTANPLWGHVQQIYTEISSQPGRMLNDYRHLGFNED